MLIPRLPADFPVPVAIVLHMPIGYTEIYAAEARTRNRALTVLEAQGRERSCAGHRVYRPGRPAPDVPPRRRWQVRTHLDVRPLDTPHRPSVDVLFQSAAEVYGERVLGHGDDRDGC